MARWVRLCRINFHGQGSREANWYHASQLLEQALWDKPDLILLPETFTGLGMGERDWFNTAEPLDGEDITGLPGSAPGLQPRQTPADKARLWAGGRYRHPAAASALSPDVPPKGH